MLNEIIAIYAITDDLLKAVNQRFVSSIGNDPERD